MCSIIGSSGSGSSGKTRIMTIVVEEEGWKLRCVSMCVFVYEGGGTHCSGMGVQDIGHPAAHRHQHSADVEAIATCRHPSRLG